MKPLLLSAATLLTLVAFAKIGPLGHHSPWRVEHFENVLGTSMELKLSAASDESAKLAEAAALAEIHRLNAILSGYDNTSEFSRWAATSGQPVPVSLELLHVLAFWDDWRTRTKGALTPAAESISRIWRTAEKAGQLPSPADLAQAVAVARGSQWTLDPDRNTATHTGHAALRLNSFTKSYIVERAADAALNTPGIDAVVLNIGGDLVVRGSRSESVAVTDPFSAAENADPIAVLQLADRAIATSGNYRRGFDIAGRHYSHIVDPRTGQPVTEIVSATVVAPKAVDAGALATALSVLSPTQGRQLAATVPGAEFLLVRNNGDRITSPGWTALLAPRQPAATLVPAAPQAKAAAGQWDPAYELTVRVEIPTAQGFGARRPYVAVWVEDKDRFPVRTLALLFNNTRWLPDLRAWYRGDRLRAMSESTEILSSVTSATRSPGKYTFKWDGKDNAGKPVKTGKYTVMIEAAREHGGYSLLRREMTLNGEPAQAQLPQDAEIGPVAIDYHKVAR